MDIKRVGFAGMGIMGSRMAKNLARKGFQVTVWNRTRARAEALAPLGVQVASSPAELAQSSDAFCSCVSDPNALRAVALGPAGFLPGAKAGQLYVDFSTVSPEFSRELERAFAGKGVDFVESPVTGSKLGAEEGSLLLMVGGPVARVQKAQPLFEAVSKKVIRCGEVGAGSQVKLAGNALLASMLEGLSEGMLLCQKAGVDPKKFLEVVQSSGYRSPYFDVKGQAILSHDFETHFSVDLMFKDLSLFLSSAAQHRVPTPVVAAVKEAYQLARAGGKGSQDIASVTAAFEDLIGETLGRTS